MESAEIHSPIWVDHPQALHKMLADLLTQPIIAADTESNSLHAYREQVCLIQFSTPKVDYLVDPLAKMDLSSLQELFSNPHIEKVFHASEYDILCLKRDFGFSFNNIFDTMIAARILGKPKVSLSDQLEAEFKIRLNKHFQKANWAQRPLPNNMRMYAGMDTHYLLPLCECMKSGLKTKGFLELADEDFLRMCDVEMNANQKPLISQVKGYYELDARQGAVLQELCIYRDQRARDANLPHFKILGNQTLLAVAHVCPRNLAELKQISDISLRVIGRHAEGLLRAVQHGLQAPPIDKKYSPRPDDAYLRRMDQLKRWRKRTADALGVLSDVILPRDILEEIVSRQPQTMADLQEIMRSIPWRFEHFGDELLQVIKE